MGQGVSTYPSNEQKESPIKGGQQWPPKYVKAAEGRGRELTMTDTDRAASERSHYPRLNFLKKVSNSLLTRDGYCVSGVKRDCLIVKAKKKRTEMWKQWVDEGSGGRR